MTAEKNMSPIPSPLARHTHIRPYRHSDGDQVRRLFSTCIVSTSVGSPLRAAIWKKSKDWKSIILYTTLIISATYIQVESQATGSKFPKYFTRVLFTAAMGALWYRMYQLYSAFLKFIDRAVTTDLSDIAKNYGMVEIDTETDDLWPAGPNGFWVAESFDESGQSQIVGCTGVDVSTYADPDTAELRRMAVSSTCRRQGIAGQLIKVALDHAKKQNLQNIFLTTCTYNQSAIGLYQKFGWVIMDEFTLLKEIQASQLKLDLGLLNSQ